MIVKEYDFYFEVHEVAEACPGTLAHLILPKVILFILFKIDQNIHELMIN